MNNTPVGKIKISKNKKKNLMNTAPELLALTRRKRTRRSKKPKVKPMPVVQTVQILGPTAQIFGDIGQTFGGTAQTVRGPAQTFGGTAQTVGGPGNTNQQGNQFITKVEMNRPNLKVLDGTAGSMQINPDKSRSLTTEKAKESPVPAQQTQAVKPLPTNTKPGPSQTTSNSNQPPANKSVQPTPGPKPLFSGQQNKLSGGFYGRMTASSFMKPGGNAPSMVSFPKIAFPAGIPKSFLIEQKLQERWQQLQSTNQDASQPPAKGPVWEAKVKYPNSWYFVKDQRSDQSGPQFNETGNIYNEIGTFDQVKEEFGQSGQSYAYEQQLNVHTDDAEQLPKQQYSPSDAYNDTAANVDNEELQDESVSQDSIQSGSKRLSAFQRLGPVTQAKKPKLTINLLFNKEQAVRKVVDQSEEETDADKYTPVHLKPDIQTSLDDTVTKYILCWPWKKANPARLTATARSSKSVMMMELEQMEGEYIKDSMFIQVSVTGYPESWTKEDVLDTVLESVKGKSLIPCFIEFAKNVCKFLVIRSRASLLAIHKYGFVINKEDVKLTLSISQLPISTRNIDFIPRLILRKRLLMGMEGETELNISEFTTKSDISHFIYFPLNRVFNQAELINLQSSVPWDALTKLDLSHNRITSLTGFDLPRNTPRLKHLDLSFNYIDGVNVLLQCRNLPLSSIALEGNPLCIDYIEQERYIKVLRMIFPGLKEIDGIKITIPGTFPPWLRNYSPPEAHHVVEKVLEVMFPLLDCDPEERQRLEDLYDVNAVVTITYMHKLRFGPIYRDFRSLFTRARVMDAADMEYIEGAPAIAKVVLRWPRLHHDPTTFNVDVMYHTETTTIVKVSGIMRVTTETLAEDEHILAFTRTIVLHSLDSVEFKITNEMIYWDLPNQELTKEAFRMTTGRNKIMSLKLEAPPNEDLKEKLLEIFMKLTDMDRKPSERCLEMKDWHLGNALENFVKLLKSYNGSKLDPLYD